MTMGHETWSSSTISLKWWSGDVLLILSYFNAEAGFDRAGYESFLGLHGFEARNENNKFLNDFAKEKGLWIGGS